MRRPLGFVVMSGLLVLAFVACGGVTTLDDPADASPGADASQGNDGSSIPADGSFDAPPPVDAGTCALPKVVGPCEAAMPRFWFDVTTGKCEAFVYGGCGGNANNFNALSQCVATCAPSATNACDVAVCPKGEACVFVRGAPLCAADCDDAGACPLATQACTCGSSCAACRDCSYVCAAK
jgi:hypothetical protein